MEEPLSLLVMTISLPIFSPGCHAPAHLPLLSASLHSICLPLKRFFERCPAFSLDVLPFFSSPPSCDPTPRSLSQPEGATFAFPIPPGSFLTPLSPPPPPSSKTHRFTSCVNRWISSTHSPHSCGRSVNPCCCLSVTFLTRPMPVCKPENTEEGTLDFTGMRAPLSEGGEEVPAEVLVLPVFIVPVVVFPSWRKGRGLV